MKVEEKIENYLVEKNGLESWSKDSIKKFSETLGKNPDEKGFFNVCVKEMSSKEGFTEENSKGFCARIIDKWKGTTKWRTGSKRNHS